MSDLAELERLAKQSSSKHDPNKKTTVHPIKKDKDAPVMQPSPSSNHAHPKQEPKTEVSLSVKLAPDQVFLASIMGKSQSEFVEWCVAEMCRSIKERLK